MTTEEQQSLQTAVLTVCDPRGNWEYGWKMICQLANLDPAVHRPPFRVRTDRDLQQLAKPIDPLRLPPRAPN